MSEREKVALRALASLYERVDKAIGRQDCRACGRCCHFSTFGHRLYVCYLEALHLAVHCGAPQEPFTEDSCGYQSGALCMAREGRSLACRTFFCGGDDTARQTLHESAHEQMRRICDDNEIPWDYRPIAGQMERFPPDFFTEVQS